MNPKPDRLREGKEKTAKRRFFGSQISREGQLRSVNPVSTPHNLSTLIQVYQAQLSSVAQQTPKKTLLRLFFSLLSLSRSGFGFI